MGCNCINLVYVWFRKRMLEVGKENSSPEPTINYLGDGSESLLCFLDLNSSRVTQEAGPSILKNLVASYPYQ